MSVTPRPLEVPLLAYWLAPSGEGPLAAVWTDKPHRLVYDLIAALHYQAATPVQFRETVDHARRVTELLEANNGYLQEARDARADHAACRRNFHTMQAAADELRKRAEKAEAERDALTRERTSLIETKREQIAKLTERAEKAEAEVKWP